MKAFRKIAVVVLAVMMLFTVVACTDPQGKNPTGGGGTGDLDPSSITKLKDITNYGSRTEYTIGNSVSYGDTTEEVAKLSARIEEKKEDAAKKDSSSIIKIFAASDAATIIEVMRNANLPEKKMKATVDYMAGHETVTEERIDNLVATGKFNKNDTKDWSFFDDWSYYEKLQDRAKNSNDSNDDDNVKRQYRNILGKVFAIGMTGDEFARLAVHELVYATNVVENMAIKAGYANAKLDISATLSDFDTYCQDELDYETLVYLRAFNDYYNGGNNNGLENSVQLYGYYYVYNETDYNSQSDEEFEKQLKYGHQTTYTNDEWQEYVTLQRNSYVKAYRYGDAFYETFYNKHFSFQEKIEKHEEVVYAIEQWNRKSYTEEMRQATRDGGLIGQLNFTDWMWCYSGDKDVMKEYNDANTANENGKKPNALAEQKYSGQFQYDMAQLKMVYYILDKMTPQNLGRTLRFQVYSYSGEMVKSAQGYKKDIALIEVDKIEPEDATNVVDYLTNPQDRKNYAIGKIGVLLNQMSNTYSTVGVTEKANNAAIQPWSEMKGEVQTAIENDYSVYSTSKAKVEALEDLVIKKTWSCGGTADECKKYGNRGHVDCTKEYDTSHNISKFVSNYEVILRHMAGIANVTFKNDTTADNNNYKINVYPNSSSVEYVCGFRGASFTGNSITKEIANVPRKDIKEISVDAGKAFSESIKDNGGDDLTWWTNTTAGPENSVASKATSSVVETNPANSTSSSYTYTYTFAGWYLDEAMQYRFDPEDKITCDLVLYAGYNVVKQG